MRKTYNAVEDEKKDKHNACDDPGSENLADLETRSVERQTPPLSSRVYGEREKSKRRLWEHDCCVFIFWEWSC